MKGGWAISKVHSYLLRAWYSQKYFMLFLRAKSLKYHQVTLKGPCLQTRTGWLVRGSDPVKASFSYFQKKICLKYLGISWIFFVGLVFFYKIFPTAIKKFMWCNQNLLSIIMFVFHISLVSCNQLSWKICYY